MDGALLCESDQKKQISVIERRLDEFEQGHYDEGGAMNLFVQDPASSERLLHPVSNYPNKSTANQSFEALKILRFEHQSRFARGKTTEIVSPSGVSMTERYHWSETLARLSLLAAVGIPIFQLLLVALGSVRAIPMLEKAHICLSALALVFVVVSASARAFRTGLTLPEEIESYNDYSSHIDMLRVQFEGADDQKRLSLVVDLELEAERELKRFLTMKAKSTFLA